VQTILNNTDTIDNLSTPQATECFPQPRGHGPVPDLDTAEEFASLNAFSHIAMKSLVPQGYTQTFVNKNASVHIPMYLGMHELSTYDAKQCSYFCNTTDNCLGFNIFFERDPLENPGTNCINPRSTTLIKCAIWGAPMTSESALNYGTVLMNFTVAIAGSNGRF
jgi:hypothetical protein